MKKLLSFALVMMLCLSAVAFAEEYTPSKTTSDMTVIVAMAENLPVGASFSMEAVSYDDLTPAEKTLVENELAAIKKAGSVEKYFAGAKDAEGNPVDLKALVGSDTLNVFEFTVLSCVGYETEYGAVSLTMQFSTPYAKGETVAVMVGLVNADQSVTWTAYEGQVVNDAGQIKVELDPETVDAIQSGTALLAIVSK